MPFDPTAYGPDVAAVLALNGNGECPMLLAHGGCSSVEARKRLQTAWAKDLFPASHAAQAALAGLWLYFGCWSEAHEIAQDISTREGNYWHAIVHRQEPDAWNCGYWFRRVGAHPIFGELHQFAKAIGLHFGPQWDPFAFIDLCEKARSNPGSELERQAIAAQKIEWQLLFDFCATAGVSGRTAPNVRRR